VAVAGAVAGYMLLEGERMGLAMKVQRPKVVAYAWVGVGAAALLRGRNLW
jgi:hypothetical protein